LNQKNKTLEDVFDKIVKKKCPRDQKINRKTGFEKNPKMIFHKKCVDQKFSDALSSQFWPTLSRSVNHSVPSFMFCKCNTFYQISGTLAKISTFNITWSTVARQMLVLGFKVNRGVTSQIRFFSQPF
jgi:hypothetical protein